jgi:hypothetical protein
VISERSDRLHAHYAFAAHDPFPSRDDDSTDPTVECDAFLLSPHFDVVVDLDERVPCNDRLGSVPLPPWSEDVPVEWWETQTARILASSVNVATNPSSSGFAMLSGGVRVTTSPSPPLRTR